MGFGRVEEKEKKGTKFVPTTPEELKAIEKRARKKNRKKKSNGKGSREHLNGVASSNSDKIREALSKNQRVRILQDRLFDTFIEFAKDNKIEKLPAFKEYLP